MSIREHLDKNNLHHAYLIEGIQSDIVPEIIEFLKNLKIKIIGNPDVVQMNFDSFKIDDARNLKVYGTQKGYSSDGNDKKIFIIFANNFLLEAQNTLLKLFEEPIENTYFFVITPDTNTLLKTLVSRFYFISTKQDLIQESRGAEKFIKMSPRDRLDFIKELLIEDEEGDEKVNTTDSTRSKALKFLNALEFTLHKKIMLKTVLDTSVFDHVFKVRQFLRMPGSSIKTLMESVALITPNF